MRNTFLVLFVMAAALPAPADDVAPIRAELTEVVAKPLEKTTVIPGELAPYRTVDIHAKVTGFVEAIHVDRGSYVKQGQALAELSAPELAAQSAEAQAKIPAVVAQRIEAEAKLAAAESTYQRLSEAAKTPGVVAGNDVILAEKMVDAERAHRLARQDHCGLRGLGAGDRRVRELPKGNGPVCGRDHGALRPRRRARRPAGRISHGPVHTGADRPPAVGGRCS